jgi:hypothetical protein
VTFLFDICRSDDGIVSGAEYDDNVGVNVQELRTSEYQTFPASDHNTNSLNSSNRDSDAVYTRAPAASNVYTAPGAKTDVDDFATYIAPDAPFE